MAVRKQIISPQEVVVFSPAGINYPTTHISKRIFTVENDVANKIWGCEFADYLDLHLVDFSGAENWESCKVYALGALAMRNGIVYESEVASNKKDPIDGVDWTEAERFDKDCLSELYVYFMRPFLAHRIYAGTLEYTTNNTGPGGSVRKFDDSTRQGGTRSATVAEMNATISTVRDDEAMIYGNMIAWLKDNATTCEFPPIKALCSDSIGPSPNINRRKAWR